MDHLIPELRVLEMQAYEAEKRDERFDAKIAQCMAFIRVTFGPMMITVQNQKDYKHMLECIEEAFSEATYSERMDSQRIISEYERSDNREHRTLEMHYGNF